MAFLTRLGAGMVPTSETVVQDGDLVHVVLSAGDASDVVDVLSTTPGA